MEFILRTPLPEFTIVTRVADGTGTMVVYDELDLCACAVLSGDPVVRHFAASAALAAAPERLAEGLDHLTATPASFVVESPAPAGMVRTQVSPHGTVTMLEEDGPQWISERGPAAHAPLEHGAVWRGVSRALAANPRAASEAADTASTRTHSLPLGLPPPVDDPGRISRGVRAALGLDPRRWQCGTPDGMRWVLWATTPTGALEMPAQAGRPRVWPSEEAVRHDAAAHGLMVQREAQSLPPALADQFRTREPSALERSVTIDVPR